MIGSTLAFSKLAENETAKAPPVRLVVDEAPVKRDGHFTTSFAPVVKKIAPAVVNVFTTTAPKKQKLQNYQNPLFDDPFFRRFFGDGFSEGQPREYRTPTSNVRFCDALQLSCTNASNMVATKGVFGLAPNSE